MKTALITGGSSGLGFELAKVFAENGYHLVLVAKEKEKLEIAVSQLQKITNVIILQADLSKVTAAEKIFKEMQNKKIFIEVLVNNAGFASHGKFFDLSRETELRELQVNIVSLTMLTKLFVTEMIERNQGIILNVSSTAAFLPGPFMAVYYASKSYVLSFSQSLSEELKGTEVTVTALCPGPTHTGFAKRANMEKSILFQRNVLHASYVARKGFEGAMNGKRLVIPGFRNWLGSYLVRFVPTSILLRYVSRMQK